MKKRLAGILALTAAALTLDIASGQTFNVKVSNTLLELNQKWADAYKVKHPAADLQVTGDETAAAFATLAEKKADLVFVPRAIRFKEAQACEAAFGRRPPELKVAVNGLAVYVHTNNLVQVLEYEELNNIFHGQTQNWKDLSGGKDQAISVYAQTTNSVLGELFDAEVLEGMGFSARIHFVAGRDMLPAIAADPNSIGFGALIPFAGVQSLSIKRAHSSTPVEPTAENIAHRLYPISRYVYSYSSPAANPDQVKAYLDWIRGDDGQQVAQAAGFYALPANLRSGP
jgi:phosphate transport system substrate-binding protein